jgi:hypothetical protein
MGGSGGGFLYGYKPRDIKPMADEAAIRTRSQEFEVEISERLNELLVGYNDRDVEKIHRYLDKVRDLLQQDIEGTLDLRFGGSVSKHTYVDGISDVDCLVHLKDPALQSMSPKEVLQYFKDKIEQRLGRWGDVSVGTLAVTIEYPDGTKIQLLPAISRESGLVIPSSRGNQWSNVIRPQRFAEKLTEVNQACNNKVVPTIKIVKSIMNNLLPQEHNLTGYHIESLAIDIFKAYTGRMTVKDMTEYFIVRAKNLVMHNIKDRTGQSVHVDDYLGSENSDERRVISGYLEEISRRVANANTQAETDTWLAAIGES